MQPTYAILHTVIISQIVDVQVVHIYLVITILLIAFACSIYFHCIEFVFWSGSPLKGTAEKKKKLEFVL